MKTNPELVERCLGLEVTLEGEYFRAVVGYVDERNPSRMIITQGQSRREKAAIAHALEDLAKKLRQE